MSDKLTLSREVYTHIWILYINFYEILMRGWLKYHLFRQVLSGKKLKRPFLASCRKALRLDAQWLPVFD